MARTPAALAPFRSVARDHPYGVLVYSYWVWGHAAGAGRSAQEAAHLGQGLSLFPHEETAKRQFLDWVDEQMAVKAVPRVSAYDQYVAWCGRLLGRSLLRYKALARAAGVADPLRPSFGVEIAPELDLSLPASIAAWFRGRRHLRAVEQAKTAWWEYADTAQVLAEQLPALVTWSRQTGQKLTQAKDRMQMLEFVSEAERVSGRGFDVQRIVTRIRAAGARMPPALELGAGILVAGVPIPEPVLEITTDVAGVAMITDAARRIRAG